MSLDLDKLGILVVEDMTPMRKLLVSVLEMMGVGRVFAAEDGARAFELYRREAPDVVLTDWHMAPMNGMELTREIRTNALSPNRMTPVILFTGYSASARVALARDTGVTEFLVKPFSANDLAKRIAYVINKPRDFIDAGGFFGPDRRRRNDPRFAGPFRRETDSKRKAHNSG